MKKIISLAIAIIISFIFLSFPFIVSADDETGMTNQGYYAAQAYLVAKYKDGKISYSEFQQQSQAVTDEFVSKNTVGGVLQSGALNASNTVNAVSQKIGNTVQKYGDSAREYINDYVSDFFNDYTVLSDIPTTDLNGGVSALYYYYGGLNDKSYYVVYYSSHPAELYYNGGELSYFIKYDYWVTYYRGELTRHEESSTLMGRYNSSLHARYGKWVWREDGTQAPTDDTYETISDYDFSQVPERELEDLLKKILDEFELQQPDLSSIEGLLNAIYARLGILDSDNDNNLLSDINSSIQSLNSSISEFSNNIETSLNDLKETVSSLLSNKDDNTDNDKVKHEIAGTLYNVIPLEKNWLQKITHDVSNLHVEYQGKQYYLEDDGTLKLGDKYYKVDMNYSSTLDEILYTLLDIRDTLDLLTEEEKKMNFNDFFDLKLDDLKTDFDEQFKFKDNIKGFVDNFIDSIESLVPEYKSGGQSL